MFTCKVDVPFPVSRVEWRDVDGVIEMQFFGLDVPTPEQSPTAETAEDGFPENGSESGSEPASESTVTPSVSETGAVAPEETYLLQSARDLRLAYGNNAGIPESLQGAAIDLREALRGIDVPRGGLTEQASEGAVDPGLTELNLEALQHEISLEPRERAAYATLEDALEMLSRREINGIRRC